MKEEDDLLTADFTDILDNNEEVDVDYVDAEVIKDDGYKFEILGYWHSKPILRQYKQYICVLGSKKQLFAGPIPVTRSIRYAPVAQSDRATAF